VISVSESLAKVEQLDRATTVIGAAAASCVALALVAFVVVPLLAPYPVVALAAVLAYGWYAHQEAAAKVTMFLTTASTVIILGLITVYLVAKSVPAFRYMGLDILLQTEQPLWTTSGDVYSLAPMMWGTLVVTAIAMTIAGPLGVAGAIFISEIAPAWAREIVKPAVETLAGIPSIVYGFLGFVVLNKYMMREFSLPTFGSLFVAGAVVGVMALPTVVSVAEDAISSVPEPMKNGALALGTTNWQTIKSVTLPSAFSGVSAAVLLGVGRAVGETMAATVILANVIQFPDNLVDIFGNTITLTSLIASQHGAAHGNPLQMSALFAAGVVLFVTVMFLSIGSQLVKSHMRSRLGGES
jgi:phosphate transport system permease protein